MAKVFRCLQFREAYSFSKPQSGGLFRSQQGVPLACGCQAVETQLPREFQGYSFVLPQSC
jgi:hypothetical protein